MLVGEYYHNIDDKNRFRIPTKIKAALGEKLIIIKGADGCLAVYSAEEFQKIQEKLSGVSIGDKRIKLAMRAVFSTAFEPEPDNQGRIALPAFLREHAGISKGVVTVGVGTYAEIWSEERWREYNSGIDFDEALEVLKEYNI